MYLERMRAREDPTTPKEVMSLPLKPIDEEVATLLDMYNTAGV